MRKLYDLQADDGFATFQNQVAREFYNALGAGYSNGENEVALVKRLVEAAQGKAYGPVTLSGAMLHGSRSYVEFNYLDQPVTRELGDMALITLVTAGSERLLQRLSIVQNKKATGRSWGLDLEQLFMLKNFPPFSGHRGIFKGKDDVTFRNSSGCLGAYGLLAEPGEMIFASARLTSEFARGKKSVSTADIAVLDARASGDQSPWAPGPWLHPGVHPREWSFFLEEWFHRFGPGVPSFFASPDMFGNVQFARDLFDLARAWTRASVGEFTCVNDVVVNRAVDAFSNYLLRSAGLGNIAGFPSDDLFREEEFGGNMGILAMRVDVAE